MAGMWRAWRHGCITRAPATDLCDGMQPACRARGSVQIESGSMLCCLTAAPSCHRSGAIQYTVGRLGARDSESVQKINTQSVCFPSVAAGLAAGAAADLPFFGFGCHKVCDFRWGRLERGRSEALKVGESITLAGCPSGSWFFRSKRVVTWRGRDKDEEKGGRQARGW